MPSTVRQENVNIELNESSVICCKQHMLGYVQALPLSGQQQALEAQDHLPAEPNGRTTSENST